MSDVDILRERRGWNGCRHVAGSRDGHYESWFQRANHPSRPLAFWIRYTIFQPSDGGRAAVGELWAIFFDGETGAITPVKEVFPLTACRFASTGIDVEVGTALLRDGHLEGGAGTGPHALQWNLDYDGSEAPLLLLPLALYKGAFPKAKALVGTPNAVFRGTLVVDGKSIAIEGWQGSQNHNWGSRHTDSYAWGQVAGFDDAPGVFLECSTAQVKMGPLWTPRMSLVVLRVDGREIALNGLAQALRARGRFEFFDWRIDTATREARIAIHIRAPRSAFVGLAYANPPGGTKTCLNTKLAACDLSLEEPGQKPRSWTTANRAAFEILTDRRDHGVPVAV